MKTVRLFISLYMLLFLFACQGKKETETIHITTEPEKTTQLPLSEIADSIEVIELETTEESLMGNWGAAYKVYGIEKYFVILEFSLNKDRILLFNRNGKFLKSIGRKGNGPGEFNRILSIAVDENKQRIYIGTYQKIICYTFQNKFLWDKTLKKDIEYIHQYRNNLLLLYTRIDEDGYNRTLCYKSDMDLHIIDSIYVQHEERKFASSITPVVTEPFFSRKGKLYFHRAKMNSKEMPTCDTLFEIKSNNLIPSIILSFPSGEHYKYVPKNIFRSSRFVCMEHGGTSYFCYDIQTKKSYNLPKGYKDDIHTGEDVQIRPFPNDSERFYYLHTNIKDTDKDEPNPTLYIGRFKQ